ncbi:AraC family transcriptional regulator [Bacillus nakamurai]|uniref:AraC family transcriptional regulator n=1 Tax=Bacillus nakamurai TaxID=1793963 RepID=UPI0012E7962A|nr:AraC family transcriptional regulator [Bacillus nakamurai]
MLELLCKSLDYIEANLDQDMTIEDIAQSAHSSKFHYQRLFLMLTGSTVSEYIRKRKLTVAAQELAVHQTKVIDTASSDGSRRNELHNERKRSFRSRRQTASCVCGQFSK